VGPHIQVAPRGSLDALLPLAWDRSSGAWRFVIFWV